MRGRTSSFCWSISASFFRGCSVFVLWPSQVSLAIRSSLNQGLSCYLESFFVAATVLSPRVRSFVCYPARNLGIRRISHTHSAVQNYARQTSSCLLNIGAQLTVSSRRSRKHLKYNAGRVYTEDTRNDPRKSCGRVALKITSHSCAKSDLGVQRCTAEEMSALARYEHTRH